MRHSSYLYAGLISLATSSFVYAEDLQTDESANTEASADLSTSTTDTEVEANATEPSSEMAEYKKALAAWKEKINVNASAGQADEQKDPFQSWNRKVFNFNDAIDRAVVRPLAVQYTEKVPQDVRGSYTQFRSNLSEPWNVVNQLIQGRPLRAAKSLGRFTVNTLTTLGLADPARRIGLESEGERFGVTMGYYGIPSGPYLVLPVFGPSTIRDGIGLAVDSQARPQKYLLEDQDGLYWFDQVWRGIDARSQLLEIEGVLTGDKYAQIRDIYLQRTSYAIAEKKGLESESLFTDIDDEFEDEFDEDQTESTDPAF
ncbi:VacJ family lipoprotein [Acinetobacter sp. LoGeW2-3]|uniref:MlaA family lipoprotein n=1 Tax=Acinetobacter sp. LoGeW2-3 TaxID=1808001 RepID=UPI000C05AE09|nr:VacJ family lipoprotein [Acinetobacter sp. LoGeW2-3]ATO19615.1 VacJ family lipoprotein [Acinetobacter sp. LoGeW2-3]